MPEKLRYQYQFDFSDYEIPIKEEKIKYLPRIKKATSWNYSSFRGRPLLPDANFKKNMISLKEFFDKNNISNIKINEIMNNAERIIKSRQKKEGVFFKIFHRHDKNRSEWVNIQYDKYKPG